MIKRKTRKRCLTLLYIILSLLCLAILYGCGTGADSPAPAPPTPTPAGPVAATINLSATPTTVKSDGSTNTTITVNALNTANVALSGIKVVMSADTGVLTGVDSDGSVTTNATTPVTVTFSSPGNRVNRTATITGTSGAVSAQIPIQIVGSTVTLESSATSLPNDGASTIDLTVTAKDAGGTVVPNTPVTLTQSGNGGVTITPAAGTTNNLGIFTATVKGASAGAVTLTTTALGAAAAKDITVTAVGANFAIDQQLLNNVDIGANLNPIAMKIGNPNQLNLRVNVPNGGTVTFATTIGVWDGGTKNTVTKTIVGPGKLNATLTTTQSGVASVQIYENSSGSQDTRTVAMSSGADPYRIILQAAPTSVPVRVGATVGSSTLTATVYDNAPGNPNPIGGAPVLFSILTTTSGGGETVSPVVVSTATTPSGGLGLGQASASFTSGSMPSGADGIQIRASVVGTAVETRDPKDLSGLNPSGPDATINIGGVAGSISFGQATVISELNAATYSWPMSVLVADSAGTAVANTDVSLSVWPIAWSTGEAAACAFDADNLLLGQGTFWNEDLNENLFLDPGEDGYRQFYILDKNKGTVSGKIDGVLTPVNSASGTVPSKVTTNADGAATFNLNYPKQSAIWTVVRLRATTKVQGSETRSELILRLAATISDVNPCKLDAPYKF